MQDSAGLVGMHAFMGCCLEKYLRVWDLEKLLSHGFPTFSVICVV